jgi:hypothetical protein
MLFTPSPPLFSQSVSSSVGSESSSAHTISVANARYVESQPHTISLSNNATLVANGPSNNQLLSTSQSLLSQLSDQDWFHSFQSSSSSSPPPSIHLTPPKTTTSHIQFSKLHRRDSCPTLPNKKKLNRFRFPTNIISSIRDALMATTSTETQANIHHTENISNLPNATLPANLWSNVIILPVANPVAAAALVEDDEMITAEDQPSISVTPSPLDTPKNSEKLHRSPTDCSANLYPSNINSSRKVTLNVGGVRHEGNLFIFIK